MTADDIQHLQTVGKDAQQARKEFILKDDQAAVWEHIKTLKDSCIHFVLDNGTLLSGLFLTITHSKYLHSWIWS